MNDEHQQSHLRARLKLLNLSELARQADVPWHRLRDFKNNVTAKLRAEDVSKILSVIEQSICQIPINEKESQ